MTTEAPAKNDVICQHCGSINDFNTVLKANQLTAWCNGCDGFIKNMPQGIAPKLYFGKYKERFIASMLHDDEIKYLQWVIQQPWCKNALAIQINTHLDRLKF